MPVRKVRLPDGSVRSVMVPDAPAAAPEPVAAPESEDEGGISLGAGLVGAAGLAGAGLLARKPGLIGKGASKLNALRQQLMLSGFAVPKSILGNVGATAIESAERGTMKPLKELFSRKTASDFVENYKNPVVEEGSELLGAGKSWLPTPGKVMGAMDTATRNAMGRAGISPKDAEKAVLQAPLTGDIGRVLDSPVARYMIPFRRTPFNQFIEGFDAYKKAGAGEHLAPLIGSHVAGAAHGAATADDRFPTSIGFGTAASAKYGLPYTVGALAGRALMGSDDGGIASAALPVGEYGLTSGVTDPLASFEPAALRALRQLMEP